MIRMITPDNDPYPVLEDSTGRRIEGIISVKYRASAGAVPKIVVHAVAGPVDLRVEDVELYEVCPYCDKVIRKVVVP